MLGGTTIESGVTQCPLCGVRLEVAADDPPEHAPYCSQACYVQDQGLRKCDCCGDFKEGESFSRDAKGDPACWECSTTCASCGVEQDDPSMLDEDGECTFCEAKRLAKAAVDADPYNPRAKRLLELIEDLAPEVRRESA